MFQIALKVKFGTSLISLTKWYLQRTNSLKSESCLKFQNEKASHQKENSLSEQISLGSSFPANVSRSLYAILIIKSIKVNECCTFPP